MYEHRSWAHLAEQASEEMDSAKLAALVADLCRAIDGERQEKTWQHVSNKPETI